MIRYAITSRVLFYLDENQRQRSLLRQAARWAADGIDYIQLREKDLPAGVQVALANSILCVIESAHSNTRLLINSRADIALATHAHGVHLTAASGELTPAPIRQLYAAAHLDPGHSAPIISRSCHTLGEVLMAREQSTDLILFGPVFGKTIAGVTVTPAAGLDLLAEACLVAAPIPVLALGGVHLENATTCLRAGAHGIAGIRCFVDESSLFEADLPR